MADDRASDDGGKSAPHAADESREPFLSRWSRLKQDARAQAGGGQPPAPEPALAAPPELPPIERLTMESDYRPFFHPEVAEDVRRAALRKLFSDPHFNAMDGLDVYIDDYSRTEPIPAAMLAGLAQAQNILRWARSEEERSAPAQERAPEAAGKLASEPEPASRNGNSAGAGADFAPGDGAAEPVLPRPGDT